MSDTNTERRRIPVAEKRAWVAIITGIITIIVFLASMTIEVTSWKNSVDFQVHNVQAKDIQQDIQIDKIIDRENTSDVTLARIDTNLEFIKKALMRLEGLENNSQ